MSDRNTELEQRLRSDLDKLPPGSRSDIAPVLARPSAAWTPAEAEVAQRMCDWLDATQA